MSLTLRTAAIPTVALLTLGGLLIPAPVVQAEPDTVTIRGYVFQFSISMFRGTLEGAVVDAEINGNPADPAVVTPVVAGPSGYYEIEVPDNADVSLFATVPPEARPTYDLDQDGPLPALPLPFHTTYNQTFHTDGDDLDFVTFQVPAEPVVQQIAAGFGFRVAGDPWSVPGHPEIADLGLGDGYGALNNGSDDVCAAASTVYRADKRVIVDNSGDKDAPTPAEYFQTFYSNPPHGRDGAIVDGIPGSIGPIYFNEKVRPDLAVTKTSVDGGVLWMSIPEGTHTVTAHKDGTRFASADITCKPGRFVNASPTWGLYELLPGEQTHPATVEGVVLSLPETAAYGSTVTADVTVGGASAADGLVSIEVDGAPAATGRVVDGTARIELPATFDVGSHQVVARYAPTGTIPTRTSPAMSLATTQAATTTAVKVSAKKVKKGKSVTATATVEAPGFKPSGTVQFYFRGDKVGQPVVITNGKAQRSIKVSRKGAVKAVYLGDANIAGSHSGRAKVAIK